MEFAWEQLDGPTGRVTATHGGEPASYADVMRGLCSEPAVRAALSSALANAPYLAFKWETPAVTRDTLGRRFECVVLDCSALGRGADAETFAEHFVEGEAVVEFASLGRDAILIAPCPQAPLSAYPHLAAFLRGAPAEQQQALWQRVGEAMLRRVNERPVWLSTAGGGVAWLHVRLDDRPKYYGFAPYREGC